MTLPILLVSHRDCFASACSLRSAGSRHFHFDRDRDDARGSEFEFIAFGDLVRNRRSRPA